MATHLFHDDGYLAIKEWEDSEMKLQQLLTRAPAPHLNGNNEKWEMGNVLLTSFILESKRFILYSKLQSGCDPISDTDRLTLENQGTLAMRIVKSISHFVHSQDNGNVYNNSLDIFRDKIKVARFTNPPLLFA